MGQVTITLTGDEARAIRALDRTQQKLRELGETGKRTGEETAVSFTKVENAFGKSFGVGALGTLGPWAVALGGIKKAADEVAAAFERVHKAQEEAGKQTLATGNALGGLGKYAGGDRATGDALSKAVQDTMRESGMSAEASAKLVEDLASAGYRGNDETTRRRALGLHRMNIEHAGRSAVELSHLGNNALGEASQLSSLTRPGEVGDLIDSTDDARELAAAVGVPQRELMASIASAGKDAGSTKTGGAQIKALMTGLKAGNFKGTLRQAVAEFGSRKTSDEHLEKMIGGKEALAGLRALQKLPADQLLGSLGPAPSEDEVFGAMAGSPDVRIAQGTAAAEGEQRDAMTDQGRRVAHFKQWKTERHAKDVRDSGGESLWTDFRNSNAYFLARGSATGMFPDTPAPGTDDLSVLAGHLDTIANNTRPKTQTVFPVGPGSDPGR